MLMCACCCALNTGWAMNTSSEMLPAVPAQVVALVGSVRSGWLIGDSATKGFQSPDGFSRPLTSLVPLRGECQL